MVLLNKGTQEYTDIQTDTRSFAKIMFTQVFVCPRGGVGGLCPGESLSRGVSVQGVLCQGDPPTVKGGQYASYWDAFLLVFKCLLTWFIAYIIQIKQNMRISHFEPVLAYYIIKISFSLCVINKYPLSRWSNFATTTDKGFGKIGTKAKAKAKPHCFQMGLCNSECIGSLAV